MYPWIFTTLERDNYSCVDCGFYSARSKLVVHHIDESRRTGKLNNNLDNLVTLCRPCHARRHGMICQREDVREYRLSGMGFQEIAGIIGVSRQRAYQIVKKLGSPVVSEELLRAKRLTRILKLNAEKRAETSRELENLTTR